MSEQGDTWPSNYYAGPHDHLHALGVIAITFANFQAAMDSLFTGRAAMAGMFNELTALYYFSLSEDKRTVAIRTLFSKEEKDAGMIEVVDNVCRYFEWCQNCRNNLLHAEPYPPGIIAKPDTLYLTKRVSKNSAKSGYMKLTLKELRDIGDRIRAGVVQCAEIRIYLRFRSEPRDKIPRQYQAYVSSLPQTLSIPPFLELALHP